MFHICVLRISFVPSCVFVAPVSSVVPSSVGVVCRGVTLGEVDGGISCSGHTSSWEMGVNADVGSIYSWSDTGSVQVPRERRTTIPLNMITVETVTTVFLRN